MLPVLGLMALAGGALTGKAYFEYEAAESQKQSIDLLSQERMLQYQQKRLSMFDVLEKTQAKQIAQMTVRGVSLSSPSFNAIQRDTYNIAARHFKNIETEQNIMELNSKIEKENVDNTLYAQLFGDVSSAAMSAAKLF